MLYLHQAWPRYGAGFWGAYVPLFFNTNKISFTARKWKHSFQECYEISLKIGPRRVLLKWIKCLCVLVTDIFLVPVLVK